MTDSAMPWKRESGTRKVGLVLGGGGARGLAHIGVLRALQREGVPIDLVAGTSMGGIVGALFAAGVPTEEIERELQRLGSPRELAKLIDLRLTQGGLLKGVRVYNLLAEKIGENVTFADLRLPLAMVAVDLYTGRQVVLKDGLVADAVRATISLPGVFEPVDLGPFRLVDGGVLNNVPVDVARQMGANLVIAVDVLPHFGQNTPGLPPAVPLLRPKGLPRNLQEFYNVTIIMVAKLTEFRMQEAKPDVVIAPDLPEEVGLLLSFDRAEEIIAIGEAATVAMMPQIRKVLEAATRPKRWPF